MAHRVLVKDLAVTGSHRSELTADTGVLGGVEAGDSAGLVDDTVRDWAEEVSGVASVLEHMSEWPEAGLFRVSTHLRCVVGLGTTEALSTLFNNTGGGGNSEGDDGDDGGELHFDGVVWT